MCFPMMMLGMAIMVWEYSAPPCFPAIQGASLLRMAFGPMGVHRTE